MGRATPEWFACDDLDAAPDPEAILDGLEAFAALAPVMAAAERALELLQLRTPGAVLEVGCGPGPGLSDLVAAGHAVTGLDRSRRALDRAQAAAPSAELHQGDAVALPFADGAFDGVRMTRVLQHVTPPEAALREARRVLRAGGRLAVVEGLQRVPGKGVEAQPTRGWVGWFLPVLLRRAGLADVREERLAARVEAPGAAVLRQVGVLEPAALELEILICSGVAG